MTCRPCSASSARGSSRRPRARVERTFHIEVDEAHPRGDRERLEPWSARRAGDSPRAGAPDAQVDQALASNAGATLVYEAVVGEGPIPAGWELALAMSLVPGRDGLAVTLGSRLEYVTPDDLLSRQAYDRGVRFSGLGTTAGVDVPVVLGLLGERFGVPVPEIVDHARMRRVRVARTIPGRAATRVVTAETMTDDDVRAAIGDANAFLARGVDAEGRFRYLVDAPTNRTLPGYDWPRHAGATYFLAQAAALSRDPSLAFAALRAAGLLRDHAMVDCGQDRCIGEDRVVDIGSAALATIAFVEIARTKLDPGYALIGRGVDSLPGAEQRPDGEFMHQFDRTTRAPIDVQFLYYSGEAALALSRSSALLGDRRDLDAARRALAHLVGPAWTFFGSRYYFGEEHWTCQAMEDLWDRAPSDAALAFCLRWHAYGRKLQYGPGDTPYDADGAYGFGAIPTPRLTPTGSRCEAGIATLAAAARAHTPPGERSALEAQVRRSLAMLLRRQLPAGAAYLLARPAAVAGAMPASEVDWQLRIDFTQHAGSALVRWLGRPR